MKFRKFNKATTKGKDGKTKPPAGRILEHNCRKDPDRTNRGNENIDPTKTHLNYDLARELRPVEYSAQQMYKIKLAEAERNYKEIHGKELRKDAVTLCGWAVTVPKDLPEDKHKQFFLESFNFLSERYGKENVISANVHLDETTPHLHFCFMPFVEDKRNGGLKLCAKGIETPKSLSKIHADLQQHLTAKLGCQVNLLNGATEGGDKTIQQLKTTALKKEIESLKQQKKQMQDEIVFMQNLSTSFTEHLSASFIDDAIKKQMPKKPKQSTSGMYSVCPSCDHFVEKHEHAHGNNVIPHCKWCGQKLDWTE